MLKTYEELILKYESELSTLRTKYNELKSNYDKAKRKSTRVSEEMRWLLAYIAGIERVVNDLKKISDQ